MGLRETVHKSIDALSESQLPEVQAFIEFQRYKEIAEMDDDTYLRSIPGMMESIDAAIAAPRPERVALEEVWPDV